MNYIDLFSGIGGFALGAYWAGMKFENHYFSEVEPYVVELYQKRFPDAIPLGDITKHKEWKLEEGEYIITGGIPCQPFSLSGKRGRREDNRHLWPIVHEFIRERRPVFCIFENVIALDIGEPLSFLEEILDDLENENYETLPPLDIPSACYNPISERRRIWIIAYADEIRRDRWRRVENTEDFQNEFERLDDADFRKAISVGKYGRGHNGIPAELVRLRGLGNAIVPQIAELLFRQIAVR